MRPPADAPVELAIIWPLVRNWGLSDDAERLALVRQMTDAQIGAVVQIGRPLLPAIEAYLGETGDAASAAPYGDFAQVVREAEREARDRH